MSAARNALVADGHTVAAVTVLDAAHLESIRILWLPLLDTEGTYTSEERTTLRNFFDGGGRINGAFVWYSSNNNPLLDRLFLVPRLAKP